MATQLQFKKLHYIESLRQKFFDSQKLLLKDSLKRLEQEKSKLDQTTNRLQVSRLIDKLNTRQNELELRKNTQKGPIWSRMSMEKEN